MRKFTNILPALFGAIILVFLFTIISCDSGTESKNEGTIIGAWQMVTIKMYDTPVGTLTIQAEQFLSMSGTGATTSILQFNEDGSAFVATTYTDSDPDTINGTWTSDGDSLTVVGAGIDDTVSFNVDGTTLTLTRIMAINLTPDAPKEDTTIDMIYSRVQ